MTGPMPEVRRGHADAPELDGAGSVVAVGAGDAVDRRLP